MAALIPVAAGAGMIGSARSNTGPVEGETRPAPQPDRRSAAKSVAERTNGEEQALLPRDRAAIALAQGTQSQRFTVLEGASELPRPSSGAGVADLAAADMATFAQFADYALSIAGRDPLTDRLRESALLATPGSLVANRAPCRFTGDAVMIDLDPADGVLEPALATPRPILSAQLARLRAEDVAIFWSSALTADRAGDVRAWLRGTGLDTDAQDEILLLRYPDDRKQTRREEAAKARCLIAMLGDERADFDELFDYLKNADAAIGLDAMLGKGWFLASIQPAPTITPSASAQPIPTEGQP
ncbi:hypothetical protein OAS19_03615 [Altererythrobacter sp.]|nr:hypothetical protein [Altererythrobacter sp.]